MISGLYNYGAEFVLFAFLLKADKGPENVQTELINL
jgi:hypothetical protein